MRLYQLDLLTATDQALFAGLGVRGEGRASVAQWDQFGCAAGVLRGRCGHVDGVVHHGASGPGTLQSHAQCLEWMGQGIADRRALVARVHHAVIALGVSAAAVVFPSGVLHQLAEAARVALVHQKIAGPLPTEHVAGRIAPRRAFVALIAGQEIQKQARLVKAPAPVTAQGEDVPEQLLAGLALEKDFLAGRVLIAVAGGYRHAFHPELHAEIHELGDFLGRLVLEQGAVDGDAEALAEGGLDGVDGLVENSVAADGGVVLVAQAIEMHGQGQIGAGLIVVQMLLQQQGVGAQIDELLAGDDGGDDLRHFRVDQRFPARYRDHRCRALRHRGQAFIETQPPVESLLRVVDLATSGAGEVTAEEGLEHQHQWIALFPPQALLDEIRADSCLLS